MKSSNGTFVNEKQIDFDEFQVLNVGDKIRLAYDQITFTVSNKRTNVTPGSPIRGSDIPCVVSDPEKSMTSALCELSDSIIDLNTSNDQQDDVYQADNYDTGDNNLPVLEQQDHSQVNQRLDDSQYVSLSKHAETFTINFASDEPSQIDNGSIGVSRFVPSKLRASFEERDKIKKKILPTKSTSKSDSVLTKNTETPKTSTTNRKASTGNLSSTRTSNVRLNPKPEETSSFRSKNLSNKSKLLSTDKSHKSKPAPQSQNQVTEKTETITKVKQSRTPKISTPTLTKRNSKSNTSEKVIEDESSGRKKLVIEKSPQSRSSESIIKNKKSSLSIDEETINSKFELSEKSQTSSKVSTPKLRKRGSNSYFLEKKPIEAVDADQISIPEVFPTFSTKNSRNQVESEYRDVKIKPLDESQSPIPATFSTFSRKNSKTYLTKKILIESESVESKIEPLEEFQSPITMEFPTFSRKNSKSYLTKKIPIEPEYFDTEIEPSNEVQSPIPVTFPTFSRKNSKSYLTKQKPIEPENLDAKIDLSNDVQSPIPVTFPTFSRKNSKSHKTKQIAIEPENIAAQIQPSDNLHSPIQMEFPTFSKKNSKSYLLEKFLMGDDSSSNLLTYEETRSTNDDNNVGPGEQISLVNMDMKGSIGNLSETGTYIIEDVVDDRTVDLCDSDDTLAKDNSSSISSHKLDSKTELESKSSGKWLSEFPDDDVTMNCDGKSKRIINSKFTGTSMPHIANDEYFLTNKRDNFRDDDHSKSNFNCLVTDNRHRINRNPNSRSADDDNNNKRNSVQPTMDCQQHYDPNLQNAYSSYSNIAYSMGNETNNGAEDFYVPDVIPKSTVPSNSCNQVSSLQQNVKQSDHYKSPQANVKHHPRSTFSVASLDTALLLQDTEALLNDMEKRVYSRKDKRDETSKSQSFSTNISHGDKIPFVDEADEKEEDSSLFSYPNEADENLRLSAIKPQPSITYIDQNSTEDKSRSYVVRSPINSGNIRRNNSCKLGISESMTLSRKLNSTLRNQRSCSMIEEQRLNHVSNNNNNNNINNNNNNNPELFNDYRSKSKPSVLAMNSGIFMNRRGSAGISSALNSPVSRLEPGAFFNNGFSVQRPKDVFPYFSTNLLSLHRQRFNRYEYGQHSLKYNSNSTTMLYSKYNNTSPPWNGEDNTISPNSFYPTYDTEYYAYNTMPEPLDASSMLLSKHDHNIAANHNNNSQVHVSNLELNPDIDYNKREDMGDYSQPCNASGRSSAFSPVNSLHQSTESVNNYQMASKSRSSIGLNEQRHCSYDILLVSSVHRYSARLCRYTEEIVHRIRREGSDYQNNSPVDTVFDQSDSFGQLKSVNRELQETVSNLRSLEKQLQKVERLLFPTEKSGRNSTAGSCTEDNYLNQLERINKELKDFVPIDDPVASANKLLLSSSLSSNAKLSIRSGEYSYLPKETNLVNNKPLPVKEKVPVNSLEPAKSPYNNTANANNNNSQNPSEVAATSKSKYSSLSKRFQHRKE